MIFHSSQNWGFWNLTNYPPSLPLLCSRWSLSFLSLLYRRGERTDLTYLPKYKKALKVCQKQHNCLTILLETPKLSSKYLHRGAVQKIVSNFILQSLKTSKLRNFQTKKVSQLYKDRVCWSATIFSFSNSNLRHCTLPFEPLILGFYHKSSLILYLVTI